MQMVSVSELVKTIFTKPPQETCTFKLHLVHANAATDKDIYNVHMFPYLMDIFMNGAMILFGQTITPQNMTNEQFELLKKYMLSLSHKVMHRYDNSDNDMVLVHIWFEHIDVLVDCKGNTLYK